LKESYLTIIIIAIFIIIYLLLLLHYGEQDEYIIYLQLTGSPSLCREIIAMLADDILT